jgi:hypothetical protein
MLDLVNDPKDASSREEQGHLSLPDTLTEKDGFSQD